MSELIQNFTRDFPNHKIIDVCSYKGFNSDFVIMNYLKLFQKAVTKPNNIYVLETCKMPENIIKQILEMYSETSNYSQPSNIQIKVIYPKTNYIFLNKDNYGHNLNYNKNFVMKTIYELNSCKICCSDYNEKLTVGKMCDTCFNSMCSTCSFKIMSSDKKECPFCKEQMKIFSI